jgi:tRNA threonylcarbamoyladenosine biosynthesis protein TsaB
MRILAIETIDRAGSLALLEDEHVVVDERLDSTRRSAQTLAPGIAALLKNTAWRPADIELVAVATGPGSFTGLRIGVTTAKTFAYANGCPAIGVNSLRAIAERVPRTVSRFSVLLDAQRNELFVADFERGSDGQLAGEETTRVVPAARWIESLDEGTYVSGPGVRKWIEPLKTRATLADESLWNPTAAEVGVLGLRAYRAGRVVDPLALVPHYYRRTAAEEQWERKAK